MSSSICEPSSAHDISEETPSHAIYVPVGPGQDELQRLADLVDSISRYATGDFTIILIDDGREDRRLADQFTNVKTCVSICNPRGQIGFGLLGGLCVSDLVACDYIASHLPHIAFALKLDTDSLVIGPYVSSITMCLLANRHIGMLGLLGDTANRADRSLQAFEDVADFICQLTESSGPRFNMSGAMSYLSSLCLTPSNDRFDKSRQAAAIDRLRDVVRRGSVYNLRDGEHCQGGAYAISPEMIKRMAANGDFEDPLLWLYLPIGEDIIMGLYCRSFGFRCGDASAPSEVFGLSANGLPYPPEELLRLGYRIIHSVKSASPKAEHDVRQFFVRRRALVS